MEQATSEDREATQHERTMRFLLAYPVGAFDGRQTAGDMSTTSERRASQTSDIVLSGECAGCGDAIHQFILMTHEGRTVRWAHESTGSIRKGLATPESPLHDATPSVNVSIVRHEPDTICRVCGGSQVWMVDIRAGWQGYAHHGTGLTACSVDHEEGGKK